MCNFHLFQIEVARRERDHGEALDQFMRYAQGIYDLAETYLFQSSRNSLAYLSSHFLKKIRHLPKILLPRTMAHVVESYFKDPHIRQLFLRYAISQGSSP